MELSSIIQSITGIVSAVVSIIALVYVIRQLKQLNTTLRSQEHASIFNMAFNLNKMLTENPEFIPFFYENKNLSKDDKNYSKLKAMVLMSLDFYEYIYAERENLSEEMNRTWLNFIQDIYCTNKILRQLMKEHESYLDSKFVKFAKAKYIDKVET